MQIKILREPNVVFECATLAFKIVNHDSYRDRKSFYASKYQIEDALLNECFSSLSDMSRSVTQKINSSLKGIEVLFKKNALGGCPAFYLLHDAMMAPHGDIYNASEFIKNISKAGFFLNFYSLLSMQDKKAKFDREVKNYNDLINFIASMNLPDDEKWELCRFYNNFETYRDKLAEFVIEFGEVYFEVYDSVENHVTRCLETIEQPINEGGVKYINSNFNLAINDTIDSVTIVPSIVLGSDMKYMYNFTGEKADDCLYVGGYFDPIGKLSGDGAKLKDLCGSLRTLGDTSKLKILKILSTGPRYGQELSAMLGISTATVSHHVSLLEEYGFIVLDRKQNRVYYSLNRDKITELIEALETELS